MVLSGITCLGCSLLLAVLPRGDERDTVIMKSGKELRCRVLLELEDRVAIQVGSREKWIKRSNIRRIESIQRTLTTVLKKFDATKDSVELFVDLARRCSDAGLPHESQLFYWRVILTDADHKEANEALGHKRSGKAWRVPVGATWGRLEQAERLHANWGSAWRLRSEHFVLKTDTSLRQAVSTLLELESFYRHTLDLFQRSLELREITEPVQVHLYRDKSAFPRLSSTVGAYFSTADNILFTHLGEDKRPEGLIHEAIHAVIFNLGGSRRGRKTELPGWMSEAWAHYMEASLVPAEGGRLRLDLSRRLKPRLDTIAAKPKIYSLRRVLNFNATDFESSSRQAIKFAQSYALMLFMLEGDGGKYEKRFLIHMRDALAGKASASAFRRVFRKEWKRIDAEYLKIR